MDTAFSALSKLSGDISKLGAYLRTQLSFLCIVITFPSVKVLYCNDFPFKRSRVSNYVYHTLCELDIHSWEMGESLSPLKAHEKFQYFKGLSTGSLHQTEYKFWKVK